jgi:hypothetical protein
MRSIPLDEITVEVLNGLIGTESEGKRLEFKSTVPGKGEDEKAEFLKDVSALANSDGGDIIYGMAEVKGIASAVLPVDTSSLDAEMLRLNQILDGGIRPRIPGVEMRPVTIEPTKGVLLVRIPLSHLGPHQVTAGQSYKFHGRNAAGTYPIEVDELRDIILRQASLPEQMRDFRRSRVALIREHPEDIASPVEYDRKLIVHYMPEQTFGRTGSADSERFTDAQLRRRIEHLGAPTIAELGLSYRPNIEGYVFMNGLATDVLQFYVQVFNNGAVEFVDGAVFRNSTNEPLIYHVNLEQTLFRQYYFARELFSVLGVEGRIAIYASALGIRGSTIMPQGPTRQLTFTGHSAAIGRDPAFFNPIVIEDMDAAEPETALEPLIQQFWRASAYDHAFSYKDGKYIGRNW